MNTEKEEIIHHEYDYSNTIPKIAYVCFFAEYFEKISLQFKKISEEEEENNKKLKYEFRNYQYRRNDYLNYEITVNGSNLETLRYKTYEAFKESIEKGNIKNVKSIRIRLPLNYDRGKTNEYISHKNEFEVEWKPYHITFTRDSNHKEEEMDQMEESIKKLFEQIPVEDTIFCSK